MTEKHRIALISCSKTKTYHRDSKRGGRVLPAELYSSELFRKRVAYIEQRGVEWFVLSARFGLWASDTERNPSDGSEIGCPSDEPYSYRLGDLSPAEQTVWFTDVCHHVVEKLWLDDCDTPIHPSELTVEIHAGREYAETLKQLLEIVGVKVEWPMEGLGIGEQLAWYKSRIEEPEFQLEG